MRKNLMLLVIVVLMPFLAMAQYSISGKVMDKKTGESLPGANVLLENTLKSTITSQNGTFHINRLINGEYNLTISYVGYETLKQKVVVEGNVAVNFQLKPSVYLQDEVIIQGTRANERTPMTVQNISKDEIKSLNMGQDVPFLHNPAFNPMFEPTLEPTIEPPPEPTPHRIWPSPPHALAAPAKRVCLPHLFFDAAAAVNGCQSQLWRGG